jgi:hypothetical protein
MSLFEQFLTFGDAISQEEKLSLYKFLLRTKQNQFREDALSLLETRELERRIADGEIKYSIRGREVSYLTKRVNASSYTGIIRQIKLSFFRRKNIFKLTRFFAQAEVDVLSNFPYRTDLSVRDEGFGFLVYPYYDLNYYSKGQGRVKGFLLKLRAKDDELLQKLLTS